MKPGVLTASDFYTYYRPSNCDLRVWLRTQDVPESEPSPYETTIRRLGEWHEKNHLSQFGSHLDLSNGSREHRLANTRSAIEAREPVIYQPALESEWVDQGNTWVVRGDPDFLLLKNDAFVIRDSKVSRRITESAHPEILRQLAFYGWLFKSVFAIEPRLEVHSGTGQVVSIEAPNVERMLHDLREIARLKVTSERFYSPVGWSKCGRCVFNHECWPKAVHANDVALVAGVDRNLAAELRGSGVSSVSDLISHFTVDSLTDFKYPWGSRVRRVGKGAEAILRMGQALVAGEEIVFGKPQIPWYADYVMFDLEGIPAQLDQLEKIYLWGFQVLGENSEEYRGTVAESGHDGDRKGWFTFLESAEGVFARLGDIPFVHWHHYERTRLEMYINRFGDHNRVAQRIRRNLLDLLPIAKTTVALPLPSYSLKVVEAYVGFHRSLPEADGDWAMATYIEATETEDETRRGDLFEKVRLYNQEDLAATWTVFNWLRQKTT